MRPTGFALALVSLVTLPFAGCAEKIREYGPEIEALMNGSANITEVAARIAEKEFNFSAQVFVKSVVLKPTRLGAFGETIKADPGYSFFYTRVRIVNDGTVDLSISNWQFSAEDEVGSDVPVELANAHDDFDGSRLRKGGEREGVVIFEMPRDERLTAVVWTGDFASARGEYDGYPLHEEDEDPYAGIEE